MAIPIVSELLTAVKAVMDWTFNTLPRPILFALFIFLLTVIGTFILPLFIMTTGTFCVDDVKYTSEGTAWNPLQNINLMFDWFKLEESTGQNETVDPLVSSVLNVPTCSEEFDIGNGTLEFYYNGGFCTDCVEIEEGDPEFGWAEIVNFGGQNITNEGYCKDDVYRLNGSELGWTQSLFCSGQGDIFLLSGISCRPPTNYFYDQSENVYECAVGNCSLEKTQQFLREVDDYLIRAPDTDEIGVVGVKCNENTPVFAVANIEIFNIKVWLMLIILIMLWWGYSKLN